jgi:hypothetical protein
VTIISRTANVTRYGVSSYRVVSSGVDVRRIEQVIRRPVPRLRVDEMSGRSGGGRAAFYQPPVVTRAARAAHAEFGRELDSRAAAQRRYRRQSPTTERLPAPEARSRFSPRPTPGFNPSPGRPTYQRPDSRRSWSYAPPERQPQQGRPTMPQTRDRSRSYERAQPQPRNQERPQPRAQERPQPQAQERAQPQPRSPERSRDRSSDNSRHKPPL